MSSTLCKHKCCPAKRDAVRPVEADGCQMCRYTRTASQFTSSATDTCPVLLAVSQASRITIQLGLCVFMLPNWCFMRSSPNICSRSITGITTCGAPFVFNGLQCEHNDSSGYVSFLLFRDFRESISSVGKSPDVARSSFCKE